MSKQFMIVALIMMVSSAAIASTTFTALDSNKDGVISATEATVLPNLADNWDALDVDGNHELSIEEFAVYEATQKK